jgi:hypothetical protein
MSDQTRFNELKAHFGSQDDANQLTFEGYALLPDKDVETLILRVKNYGIKDELVKIRARAKQAVQASPQAGKYIYCERSN